MGCRSEDFTESDSSNENPEGEQETGGRVHAGRVSDDGGGGMLRGAGDAACTGENGMAGIEHCVPEQSAADDDRVPHVLG